jgi:hypothetical protein
MRQHRLDEAVVISILEQPDQLLPSAKNRYNALKRVNGGIIRVTFVEEADKILVITVSPRKHFQEEK